MNFTVTLKNKHTNKIVKGAIYSKVECSEKAFYDKLKNLLYKGFVFSVGNYTIDDSYKVLKVSESK